MNITKMRKIFSDYIQTIFLLLGCLLVVAGVAFFSWKIALILAGVIFIALAFLVNYEKRSDSRRY